MANVAQDKMNEIVARVIKSIENNETGIWSKSWIGGGLPMNHATKTLYSGLNTIFLMFEQEEKGYTTNRWITFNQIRKIKRAKLKKGSSATPVFFFKLLDKKEENEEGEEVTKKIPLLKFYYVYNLDQVEGIKVGAEKEENIDLNEFVANTEIEIKTRPEAFYNPKEDYIGIPDLKLFKSTETYAATLLHELTHATGHKSRLDRDLSGRFGSESYSKEECIAELGSLFLMAHLKIEGEIKNSEAYIKNWLIKGLKEEPKMLWKLASEAQKAFNFLLSLQKDKEIAA